ncbi:MAG: Gfo/Idh/MocA family oxidoreductase, partial [Planctomycetes bacterium]|nr:Gfo/Idh/MocA family oxidoreductase [Planctomycetota bacterium]
MALDKSTGWGIIGCGGISKKFAAGLKGLQNARLVAVGARNADRARDFAAKNGFERSYGSYEELVRDPDIDVVYIGSIHPAHMKNTLLCIENGKSVLCEKPFAMNAGQAKKMIDSARSAGVFLMEAMWTRFIPGIVELRKLLAEGSIGEAGSLSAGFGFKAKRDLEGRLFSPQLGGGALLDVGIYPVSFASMIFGCQPRGIESTVEFGPTGIDEKAAIVMDYGNNRSANLSCSINTNTDSEAVICGAKGMVRVGRKFWSAEKIT